MFTRVFFVGIALLAGAVIWMALAGSLPGQDFHFEKKVETGHAQRYPMTEKGEGVFVPFTISPELFPKGLPPQLRISISTSAGVNKKWNIAEISGKEESADKETAATLAPADPKTPGIRMAQLDGLKSKSRYQFFIYFERQVTDASVDEALLMFAEKDKYIRVLVFSKEK